jgi:hypothetical protein
MKQNILERIDISCYIDFWKRIDQNMKKGKLIRKFLVDKKDDSSSKSNLKPKQWIKSYGDYKKCETEEFFDNNLEENSCIEEKNFIEIDNEDAEVLSEKIRTQKNNDIIDINENKKIVYLKETPSKTTLNSNDPPEKKKKSIFL